MFVRSSGSPPFGWQPEIVPFDSVQIVSCADDDTDWEWQGDGADDADADADDCGWGVASDVGIDQVTCI